MLRKAILLCIGLCCPIILFGQGQTTHWYFGDGAGLRFNTDGSVSTLSDGKISTYEGCATISDDFGSLLFYTDGIVVYNRDHQLMENGFGLLGDSSSTQSAIIVPNPDDPDIYYIFSVDTAITPTDADFGLHYSIVDLSQGNGLGAVVQKNNPLIEESSEKIAAVIRNCFDRSIWVITMAPVGPESRFIDSIYAWEVTATGVKKKPVRTTFPELQIEDPRGYLKLSPDATILASANQTSGLYLFDYDVTTGKATGYTRIYLPEPFHNPYGIEFSPDGRFLYVHSANEVLAPKTNYYSLLLQLDLKAPDVQASIVQLDSRPIYRGALQLGENGKIYRTLANSYWDGTSYLGVINNPNALGLAADYQHDAIDLGKISHQGLPPFIQSFSTRNDLVKNDDGTRSDSKTLCEGQPFTLETDNIPGALYIWEKDGVLEPTITGFQHRISNAAPTDSGNYRVEIVPIDPTECPIIGTSTVKVLPRPKAQMALTQCDYDLINSADGITRINLEAINSDPELSFEFFESIADRDNNIPIPVSTEYTNTQAFAQTIYYRTTNSLGCSNDGQLDLVIVSGDIQAAPNGPVYSCDEMITDTRLLSSFDLDYLAASYAPLDVTFFASAEDLSNNVNPLSGQLITESTTIYARKQDGSQCLGADRLDLIVKENPELSMPDTFALCKESGELVLTAPTGFNNFTWYKSIGDETKAISKEPTVTLSNKGDYSLEARIDYGSNSSATSCLKLVKFKVTDSETATITDVTVNDFSANNTIAVDVDGTGIYEYSLDGENYQDTPFFENIEPGILSIHVRDKNGCGIAVKEIAVLGYPKFFTPNGDGVNDYWQLTGVNDEFEPDALIMIYDRYGAIIAQISPASSGWSGKSDAHMFPASDYWFRVILRSGREFTGHFALKR